MCLAKAKVKIPAYFFDFVYYSFGIFVGKRGKKYDFEVVHDFCDKDVDVRAIFESFSCLFVED